MGSYFNFLLRKTLKPKRPNKKISAKKVKKEVKHSALGRFKWNSYNPASILIPVISMIIALYVFSLVFSTVMQLVNTVTIGLNSNIQFVINLIPVILIGTAIISTITAVLRVTDL